MTMAATKTISCEFSTVFNVTSQRSPNEQPGPASSAPRCRPDQSRPDRYMVCQFLEEDEDHDFSLQYPINFYDNDVENKHRRVSLFLVEHTVSREVGYDVEIQLKDKRGALLNLPINYNVHDGAKLVIGSHRFMDNVELKQWLENGYLTVICNLKPKPVPVPVRVPVPIPVPMPVPTPEPVLVPERDTAPIPEPVACETKPKVRTRAPSRPVVSAASAPQPSSSIEIPPIAPIYEVPRNIVSEAAAPPPLQAASMAKPIAVNPPAKPKRCIAIRLVRFLTGRK